MSVPVCVRNLTKSYGPVEAVQEASFDVASGEVFGLLGPNGAGKTTTLECILGLRHPDSGTITIGGIDALVHPERAKQLVGAQIQAAALQDKITPREALKLFASFYDEPDSIDDLIERFSLSSKVDATFDTLSSGQKRRLLLALAFVNNPRLVVLDEPTAGLDPRSRRDLHAIIHGMRASGRTVLMSTHYLDEAHSLCDRIGILDEGRILAVAKPDDLIAKVGAPTRLGVKTEKPLNALQAKSLPGVVGCESRENGWLLATADANRTMVGLVQQLAVEGNRLLDLQILRPSLEDAFIELTGKAWSGAPQEDE